MNAYHYIQATASIGLSGRVSSVTFPVCVLDRIAQSIPFLDESHGFAPLDSIVSAEFVLTGLLTPNEAAVATFSYATV